MYSKKQERFKEGSLAEPRSPIELSLPSLTQHDPLLSTTFDKERNPMLSPHVRQRWRKVATVFKSICLMKREQTISICNHQDLANNMSQFVPPLSLAKTSSVDLTDDPRKQGFREFDRVNAFVRCCQQGGDDQIHEMARLLQQDPRRNMWAPGDPQHLVNRLDSYGICGLYAASLNGNLDVVTFLLRIGANPNSTVKVANK